MKKRLLLSACLLGLATPYHGKSGNSWEEGWRELVGDALQAGIEFIPVCPEQLGGLPTPRPPAELQAPAESIFRKAGEIVNIAGQNVTAAFLLGASQTLVLAQRLQVCCAVLKSRSPSCGVGKVYSGRFDGTLVEGDGVTAHHLAAAGFLVLESDPFLTRWRQHRDFSFLRH